MRLSLNELLLLALEKITFPITLSADLWMLQILYTWIFMFMHAVFIIIMLLRVFAAYVCYVCKALTYI